MSGAMRRVFAGSVASLFVFTAAYAGPPGNFGNQVGDYASHVASGNGAPAHAKEASGGVIGSGHAFGAAVSGMGKAMGEHASQNAGSHGGGAQANR